VGFYASCRVLDCLAKGLAELGHTVFYFLEQGAAVPPAPGVTLVGGPAPAVDIIHVQVEELVDKIGTQGTPWVRTCHVDVQVKGLDRTVAKENWIYVSRTLAETYGSDRYVLNAVDPSEFLYSETKDDYLLFVCGLERAMNKGLDVALGLASQLGFRLIVAGSSWDAPLVDHIAGLCREHGAEYVGEVYGVRKAALFAGAKALLFPTKWNEAFGLVMIEALMSGTPVICSNNGACPEIISPEVGFVCANEKEYIEAVERIGEISPTACREKAMRDYHYLRMARDYVREYEREIARTLDTQSRRASE
jgi:glycosyltransferase involved in cell wall biosynthesis